MTLTADTVSAPRGKLPVLQGRPGGKQSGAGMTCVPELGGGVQWSHKGGQAVHATLPGVWTGNVLEEGRSSSTFKATGCGSGEGLEKEVSPGACKAPSTQGLWSHVRGICEAAFHSRVSFLSVSSGVHVRAMWVGEGARDEAGKQGAGWTEALP